jgi:hypothetical protein
MKILVGIVVGAILGVIGTYLSVIYYFYKHDRH